MRKGWLIRDLLGIPEPSFKVILTVFILSCIVILVLRLSKK